MSSTSLHPIRTALLMLLVVAGLLALFVPMASAADDACPVDACVIDDGLANSAAPDVQVEGRAAAPAPQEISDDADDLGLGDAGAAEATASEPVATAPAATAAPDASTGTNVDADHPIGDAWAEAPREQATAVAGAAAAPAATGSGSGFSPAPSGALPFTGISSGALTALAGLGATLLLAGSMLRRVGRRTVASA